MSRMDKINQQIKREIGDILQRQEVSDPRVQFVSITYVDTSPDLSHARVGFSVLSDDPVMIEKAEKGLVSAARRIRKLVSSRIVLRHNPELRFVYDGSIREGLRMDQMLDDLKRQREERHLGEGQEDENSTENN